jgi:hypothetical protein
VNDGRWEALGNVGKRWETLENAGKRWNQTVTVSVGGSCSGFAMGVGVINRNGAIAPCQDKKGDEDTEEHRAD